MTGPLPSEAVVALLLLDVGLVVALAAAFGVLARRAGQPTIVGQILAGVVLGPTLLGPDLPVPGVVHDLLACDRSLDGSSLPTSLSACLFPPQVRTLLGILGQLGLVLYMLVVGIGVDTGRVRGRMRAVGLVSLVTVAVPVAIGLPVGAAMHDPRFVDVAAAPLLPFQLLVGTLLAVTAFPVMAHVLRERGIDDSPAGVVALLSAAAITVLMFLVLGAAFGVRDGGVGGLVVRGGLIVGLLAATHLVLRPALSRLAGPATGPGTRALATVLVVATAWALASHLLGVTVIVGAFLVGLALPRGGPLGRDVSVRVHDLTVVVLVPVFLTASGLQTDVRALDASMLPLVLLFLVAAVVSKLGGGAVSARLAGLRWRDGLLVGALVNCRGLLPLVVAMVATERGMGSPALQTTAVVMALTTTAMTGPVCDRVDRPAVARHARSTTSDPDAPSQDMMTRERTPLHDPTPPHDRGRPARPAGARRRARTGAGQ